MIFLFYGSTSSFHFSRLGLAVMYHIFLLKGRIIDVGLWAWEQIEKKIIIIIFFFKKNKCGIEFGFISEGAIQEYSLCDYIICIWLAKTMTK